MFDIALILLFVVKDIARLKVKVNQSCVSPVHQPVCCFLPQGARKDCWCQCMVWEHWWLWDRAACVNFHMFTTCTGHFPDPQLSLPVTHAYTHTFIFLLLSVLLFLISCLTDILQPCAYLHIVFHNCFLPKYTAENDIRYWNVFFCRHIFMFFLILLFFLYQYLLSFLLLEVIVVRVV